MLSRRSFLHYLAAGAAASFVASPMLDQTLHAQTNGLRTRATAKNMFFGAATTEDRLRTDTAYRQAVIDECGILTAEYEMKWDRLRPTASTYYFTGSDYIVNFARQNGMLVHGHTLCWHQALPSWFSGTVNRTNAEQFLRDHIKTVVGRYKGQVYSWDVVNEVIQPSDNTPNKLRNSPWYQFLGENYIEIAFRAAAEADPAALLVYNEYDVEFDDTARTDAILNLLKRLQAKRVPIHALGIQAHIRSADTQKFNANMSAFRKFLNDVAALGLKIIITEFDCDDRSLPSNTQQRDDGVAKMYGDYCSVAMNNTAVIGFITWGISDKYTNLNTTAARPDGQQQRPLPLDNTMQRKSAWYALEWWFLNTSTRPRLVTGLAEYSSLKTLECAPNPASSQTVLSFQVERAVHIRLSLVDAVGREIAELGDELFAEGEHQRTVDVTSLAEGVYWCVLHSATARSTVQIVVQR